MPEINRLIPAIYQGQRGTTAYSGSIPSALGYRKYIASLNRLGVYRPGTYRCNPNKIFTVTCRSIPSRTKDTKVAGQTAYLEGDLASYLFCQGTAVCTGDLTPQWAAFRQQEAINKAYAKIMNNELDVGVMIGEMRETVEGLVNPLSSLRKEFGWLKKNWNKLLQLENALQSAGYFKSLRITDSIQRLTKRVALGGLPRSANALANSYLEWRFGIRPIIQTIEDILEHLEKQSRLFEDKLQKRKGKTTPDEDITRGSASTSAGIFSIYGNFSKIVETKYVASVAFSQLSPLTWQQKYGLDYSALTGIAWELVPLSFVLDRFYNVGSWLDALRAQTAPVTFHGVSVTNRYRITIDGYVNKILCSGVELPQISGSAMQYQVDGIERKCLPPGFNTVLPALNSRALDLQQHLDHVALLWQKIPKFNLKR